MPPDAENSSKLSGLSDEEIMLEADLQCDKSFCMDPRIYRELARRGIVQRFERMVTVESELRSIQSLEGQTAAKKPCG